MLHSKFLLPYRLLLNRIGLRKKKVFAIGFNKTGTSSLHQLFKSLGRPSYHGTEWRSGTNRKLLNSYDCFSDDIPENLSGLDYLYPGSKFILQVRDLDSWVFSRLAHIERRKTVDGYAIGNEWDTSKKAVKSWILKRNRYHLFVLDYFTNRPEDLLVLNFIRDEFAVEKIVQFLGETTEMHKPDQFYFTQT